MPETDQDALEFYTKNPRGFRFDFWASGNKNLKIEVEPRANVESREWWTATWQTEAGANQMIEAQRPSLLWERIIKRFLEDAR